MIVCYRMCLLVFLFIIATAVTRDDPGSVGWAILALAFFGGFFATFEQAEQKPEKVDPHPDKSYW